MPTRISVILFPNIYLIKIRKGRDTIDYKSCEYKFKCNNTSDKGINSYVIFVLNNICNETYDLQYRQTIIKAIIKYDEDLLIDICHNKDSTKIKIHNLYVTILNKIYPKFKDIIPAHYSEENKYSLMKLLDYEDPIPCHNVFYYEAFNELAYCPNYEVFRFISKTVQFA